MGKMEEKDLEKKELEKKFSDQIAKMTAELEAVKDEKERVKMVSQLEDADKQNKEVLQHLKDDMDSLQKQVDDGKEAMKHIQDIINNKSEPKNKNFIEELKKKFKNAFKKTGS